GRVDPLFPLRCAWRRAIVSSEGLAYRRDVYNVHGVQTANRGRKVHLARATTMTRKVFRVTGPNPFLTFVAAKAPSSSNLPRPSAWRTSRCVRRYPKAPNKQRAASNLCPSRKVRMSARTNRGGFRNREAFFFAWAIMDADRSMPLTRYPRRARGTE